MINQVTEYQYRLYDINTMGNIYEKTYIVGEVDCRAVALDMPLLYKVNTCIRYPSYFTSDPEFNVDYNQTFRTEWLFVSNREMIGYDRDYLMTDGKVTMVMIECQRNIITGYYSDCKIINYDMIEKVKPYAKK